MSSKYRFIRNIDISAPILRVEDNEMINQVKNVFRLKPGDKIALCDGQGRETIAEIKSFFKNGVELATSEIYNIPLPEKQTVLYLSLLKKDNFELVIQKATECGATEIVPLITERTVKLGLNIERARKIALEAAEQSGRGTVPEISEPVKFIDATVTASKGMNIFCDISGQPITEVLPKNRDVSLWIGPEGGWTEEELRVAEKHGFIPASLGQNTLRAETAAIVAVYLAAN